MPGSIDLLIYGSGALACLFAFRLARAGQRVGILDHWEEGVRAIQAKGICQQTGDLAVSCQPVPATSSAQDLSNVPAAIVLVKSWQTAQAAADLAACLAPSARVLTLQNGLGNAEILAGALGSERVAAGSTTSGATLLAPGCFRPGGEGVNTLPTSFESTRLCAALRAAGFQLAFTQQLTGLLWGKLLINAAINPLTALLEVPNGQILELPHARRLLAMAVEEAAQAARAAAVELPYTDPLAEVESVLRRTAANQSSMLQDILRGAPTEIDAITGALLHSARQNQLWLPTHETLYQLVRAKVDAGRLADTLPNHA